MGVPVVTLRHGHVHAHDVGVTILHAIGRPEWVGNNDEEYVSIACNLASDIGRLAEMRYVVRRLAAISSLIRLLPVFVCRRTLRSQMLSSVLCNGPPFVQNLENAYRQMWTTWCQNPL